MAMQYAPARETHCPTCNCLGDGLHTDRLTQLIAQDYYPIDPFTELRVPVLHIKLQKAQARISMLEAELQLMRKTIYDSQLKILVKTDGDYLLVQE